MRALTGTERSATLPSGVELCYREDGDPDGRPLLLIAGLGLDMLDGIAADVVEFETRKSTAMSFAAGVPGGFAMIGTIPGDITQFYVHAFRIMQKVAYVYGWTSFLEDTEEIDDETLGKLAAFLGVMMGVGGASTVVTVFAASVARPAVQKQIVGVALTKTT